MAYSTIIHFKKSNFTENDTEATVKIFALTDGCCFSHPDIKVKFKNFLRPTIKKTCVKCEADFMSLVERGRVLVGQIESDTKELNACKNKIRGIMKTLNGILEDPNNDQQFITNLKGELKGLETFEKLLEEKVAKSTQSLTMVQNEITAPKELYRRSILFDDIQLAELQPRLAELGISTRKGDPNNPVDPPISAITASHTSHISHPVAEKKHDPAVSATPTATATAEDHRLSGLTKLPVSKIPINIITIGDSSVGERTHVTNYCIDDAEC